MGYIYIFMFEYFSAITKYDDIYKIIYAFQKDYVAQKKSSSKKCVLFGSIL